MNLPSKPAWGLQCNGCGYCCQQELCKLAKQYLPVGAVAPCSMLEYEDGRSYCGLVRRPAHYLFGMDKPVEVTGETSSIFAYMLGLGVGCDSDDPS